MKFKGMILFAFLCLQTAVAQDEVIYHVFQRSFFDADNDGQGDLNGINQKLDYLQDLGVTSVLLTPLYVSDFYHNYFAQDFEKIDPEYGTMKNYLDLVREVHKRKMKIYQDVEMQYVAGTHPWFMDSFGNPKSVFSEYLLYDDAENKKPVYFYSVPEFTLYDNSKQQIAVVNMKSEKVKAYTEKVLQYWIDPNNDGKFDDGVDGFRLDHMMDNLDNMNRLTNLFADFWTPVLTGLRAVNPKIKIIAEQANWASYGHDYLTDGSVDEVFAFRLAFAIPKFDKAEIEKAADSTFNYNPKGKNQLVFLENHDTNRFASHDDMTLAKAKAAAAIQLLIGGIPSIYYGQEIGMKGKHEQFGTNDGNDIPVREAFDWYASDGKGMPLWYKDTGVWWDKRNQMPNDGISLEEQKNDPKSLWNFYKGILRWRSSNLGFTAGSYRKVINDNPYVLTFSRANYIVVVNFSGQPQLFEIGENHLGEVVYGKSDFQNENGKKKISAYGIMIVKSEVKSTKKSNFTGSHKKVK
ncbi:alpha-amylase family glycosyl hydrolase [Flavobacterium sp.]|uniref:alpha-amylase family glycosyl hydrolase n=1 Tax=Flavobacterium sp. TaxID=239 RepID=UPI0026159810|nr:alpha-amylase family glycosyl hydrolase [Flavobacterium sp.]